MKILSLHRYPVKSLRGHALSSAHISPLGIEGDRRWMVVDGAGKFLTIREIPAMTLVDVESRAGGIVLSHATHGSVAVEVPSPEFPTARSTSGATALRRVRPIRPPARSSAGSSAGRSRLSISMTNRLVPSTRPTQGPAIGSALPTASRSW